MTLAEFIWDKFPDYFSEHDTNKDVDGKGSFQRYLSIFGLELDDQVIPGLESFIDNMDPSSAVEYLIPNVAFQLGTPDDILGDLDKYRILLISLLEIKRLKGTFRSYRMLFSILGLSCVITEKFLDDNQYDDEVKTFDDEATIYDNDMCQATCIHYDITYDNLPGETIAPLSEDLELKLRALIIELVEPSTAELDYLNGPVLAKNLHIINNSTVTIRYLDVDLNTVDLADNDTEDTVLPIGSHIIIESEETQQYYYTLNGVDSDSIEVELNHTIIVLFDSQLIPGSNTLTIHKGLSINIINRATEAFTVKGTSIEPDGSLVVGLRPSEFMDVSLDPDFGWNIYQTDSRPSDPAPGLQNTLNTVFNANTLIIFGYSNMYFFNY